MASCGGVTTCVVTDDGELYTFGRGGDGRLGLGDTSGRWEPTPVKLQKRRCYGEKGDESGRLRCLMVSAGAHHTAVVSEDGGLWCFGRGTHGQLGVGDSISRSSPVRVDIQGRVKYAACGQRHTLAVVHVCVRGEMQETGSRVDGHASAGGLDGGEVGGRRYGVEVWGIGQWRGGGDRGGAGGRGEGTSYEPVLLECFRGWHVTLVSCGTAHSVAVCGSGDMFTWGAGEHGQLGHGDFHDVDLPRPLSQRCFHGRAKMVMAACFKHTQTHTHRHTNTRARANTHYTHTHTHTHTHR